MSKKKKQIQRMMARVLTATGAAGQVFAARTRHEAISFKLPVQGGWMVTKLEGVMHDGALTSGALLQFERLAGKNLEIRRVPMNLEQPKVLAPLPYGACSPNLAVRVLKEVLKRGYRVG